MALGGIAVRGAVLAAYLVVGLLLALGLAVTLTSESGSVGRDLGLALLSGAIVGGALVIVESLLQSAASRRSAHDALLSMLSSSGALNGIDLAGESLPRIYLPGRAMVAANLVGTNLEGAKLFFGDLRHADLTGANLAGADLSGASLAGARLDGANLSGAILDDVDLTAVIAVGCNLSAARVVGARLTNARLDSSDLRGVEIRNSYLLGTNFTGVRVNGARFEANEHDGATRWPERFTPPVSRPVHQPPIASMDLAGYLAHRAGEVRSADASAGSG